MESKQSAVPRVGRRGRLAWFPARPRRIITPSSAGHGRYSLARESACSPFAPLTAEQPSEPPREPHDSQRQESSCGNTSRVRDHPPVLPRGDRARRQRHQEPKTSLRWRLKLFWSQQFLSGSEVVAVFNPADFGLDSVSSARLASVEDDKVAVRYFAVRVQDQAATNSCVVVVVNGAGARILPAPDGVCWIYTGNPSSTRCAITTP